MVNVGVELFKAEIAINRLLSLNGVRMSDAINANCLEPINWLIK